MCFNAPQPSVQVEIGGPLCKFSRCLTYQRIAFGGTRKLWKLVCFVGMMVSHCFCFGIMDVQHMADYWLFAGWRFLEILRDIQWYTSTVRTCSCLHLSLYINIWRQRTMETTSHGMMAKAMPHHVVRPTVVSYNATLNLHPQVQSVVAFSEK